MVCVVASLQMMKHSAFVNFILLFVSFSKAVLDRNVSCPEMVSQPPGSCADFVRSSRRVEKAARPLDPVKRM